MLRVDVLKVRRPLAIRLPRFDTIRWVCVGFLVAVVLLAIFGPLLVPYDPDAQDVLRRLEAPSLQHWLGMDSFGRDVLARLALGLRTTLVVAAASTVLGLVLGTVAGITSAYIGGWFDTVFASLLDVMLVFPTLLFGMILMIALGPGSNQLILAATVVLAIRFARIARAQTYALKEREFVESARAIGSPGWYIVLSDLVPNVLPHNVGLATYWFDRAVSLEAGLSFLGIGIQPPRSSVGLGLREAVDRLFQAPWLVVTYAGLLAAMIICLSLLADYLGRGRTMDHRN